MADKTAAIRTENLTKIYGHRHIALNSVDVEIAPGTALALLGNNGAGKTTFVKLLLGLQTPTAGRVLVFGDRMSPGAARLRQRIGYLAADPRFPPAMSPIEYLDFAGRLSGMPRRHRRPALAHLLRAVDLLRVSGQPIRLFSTGMRARLAIAASLLGQPDILIWDEPSQGLDAEARRTLLLLLRSLAEGRTLVLCSHHLAEVQQVCGRAIVLHEGQVVFHDDLDKLRGPAAAASVEMTLLGERKEIAEAVKAIGQFEEVAACELAKTLLRLRLKADASVAAVLANVLVTLADKSVEVGDVRLAGDHADQAIANLLREEGSRGLTRAYAALQR